MLIKNKWQVKEIISTYYFFLCISKYSVFLPLSGSLSIIGTIFGVLGSLSLCLYSIYTKRTLPHVNQEIWLLSYYNNVYSCILFLPLIVMSGEHRIVASYPLLASSWFWSVMIIGGICGFSIGFVTALQIKVISSYHEIIFQCSIDKIIHHELICYSFILKKLL